MSDVGSGLARDKSILSLTGVSQTATGLNGNRRFLAIENTGAANIGVNITGGVAAIGGTGTLTVAPLGAMTFDIYVPQNAINIIGPAGQLVVVVEG